MEGLIVDSHRKFCPLCNGPHLETLEDRTAVLENDQRASSARIMKKRCRDCRYIWKEVV